VIFAQFISIKKLQKADHIFHFMAKIECPSCFFEWESDEDIMVGEVISCPDCGVDLEVVEVGAQIKVKVAEVGKEDWGE
jgi:alpha-aminoadipate carrier protein LysW